MNYLVTGATGFIGYDLVKYLAKDKNNFVFATDRTVEFNFGLQNVKYQYCELKDTILVSQLPKVDCVVHLAAFNGTKFFYTDSYAVIKDNVIGTINLIDRYRNSKPQFVYAGTPESTAGATELGQTLPTNEDSPLVVMDPTNPRWSYAGSKALGEQAVIHSGLDWKIIRYNNVYGPRQKDHFIPEFVARVKKGIVELHGHSNTRTFLHIKDACEGTIAVLNSGKCNNQIINIGGNRETTIKEVAEIILRLMKVDKKIDLNDAPMGSATRRWPAIDKIKILTGWEPKINLEEGLKDCI